jgi:hypothetical protein
LDFEMLALKQRNTCTRQTTFKQLDGGRNTEKNCEWNAIKPGPSIALV